jgi:TPR repeat protein
MNKKKLIGLFLLIAGTGLAQTPELRNIVTQGFGDLGTIKVQAEQGDVIAQVKLADAYLSDSQPANALNWYTAAAKQKSVEAEYQIGNLLLFGRFGFPKDQSVSAKPMEGLKWTYLAATNGNQQAWCNMAKALQSGAGCATNLVDAYSWLILLADAGDIVGRVEMNNLSLKLSSTEILRGKSLAEQMKLGHWPPLQIEQNAQATLILKGISGTEGNRFVIINNSTLSENDVVPIETKTGIVKVKCIKINDDSVLVKVEGEDKPRLLQFK